MNTTMKKEEASDTRLKIKKKQPGKEKDYELKIGIWSVRTGALHELRNVITSYGADVVALQEMRWKGSGILRDRVTMLTSIIIAKIRSISSNVASQWEVDSVS